MGTKPTKEQLRKSLSFHRVNPDELEGIAEWAEWLEAIFHNPCSIWEENGNAILIDIRATVDRLGGLQIEIHSKEHAPPHFHVKSPNVDASFKIENCELINGKISNADHKKIKYWHRHAKSKLIKCWDSTRPTDCVVGPYQGA